MTAFKQKSTPPSIPPRRPPKRIPSKSPRCLTATRTCQPWARRRTGRRRARSGRSRRRAGERERDLFQVIVKICSQNHCALQFVRLVITDLLPGAPLIFLLADPEQILMAARTRARRWVGASSNRTRYQGRTVSPRTRTSSRWCGGGARRRRPGR